MQIHGNAVAMKSGKTEAAAPRRCQVDERNIGFINLNSFNINFHTSQCNV